MSSHEKALNKLLAKNGYECTNTNDFGVRVFERSGCTRLVIYPRVTASAAVRFTQQIEQDVKKLRPAEPENDWEAAERKRAEAQKLREAADAARVKNTRLGGLSKVLTEREVDQVARKAERLAADFRTLDHIIREAPLGAGRKR